MASELIAEERARVDDALLESLLHEALGGSDANDEARITALLLKLDSLGVSTGRTSSTGKWRPSSRWLPLAIAASLIILSAWIFWNDPARGQAYAAVIRSMRAMDAVRQYRVEATYRRRLVGERSFVADLYLDEGDRFVVRLPSLLGRSEVWLGGTPNDRWLVPAHGPVLVGGKSVTAGWLANSDSETPYFYLATVLERMSRAYDLEMLEPEELAPLWDGSQRVLCDHVVGSRREGSSPRLPAKIELWADKNSGVAQRIELDWKRPESGFGPVHWTIKLAGYPDLADDWFDYTGHCRDDHIVKNAGTVADLEAHTID
ncbi:MAG: hypothetical protein R3E01_07970 [Pirellulaceae bacterium]|nr:hypothetical protein [Planctomycetales bacterium]